MKLNIVLFFLLILAILSPQAQSRRGRISLGRGRFSGLSKIGQGIGKGLQELFEDDEEEERPTVDKKIASKYKGRGMTDDKEQANFIESALIFLSVIIIGSIAVCCCMSKASENFKVNNRIISNSEIERNRLELSENSRKHYGTLKFINQHGVHPDRNMKMKIKKA